MTWLHKASDPLSPPFRRNKMTPNDIEILIHCYVSPTEHPRYHANHDVFNRLVTEGLIQGNFGNNVYMTTEKGKAHMSQLCDLPYPKQAWVNDKGEVIAI